MLFETNSVSIILYRGITGWACSQLIIRRYTAAINFMLTFCVFLCTHVFSYTNIPRYMHSLRFCFLRFVLSRYRAIWQYYECPVTVRQLLRTWINTSAWLPGDWQYNYNNTEHNKTVTIPRPRKNTIKKIIETKDSVADLFSLKTEIWWKYISLCTYVGKSRTATVVDIHILYYGCILSP